MKIQKSSELIPPTSVTVAQAVCIYIVYTKVAFICVVLLHCIVVAGSLRYRNKGLFVHRNFVAVPLYQLH